MKYCFANCILDEAGHVLLRDGEPVSVEPLVFDLLHLLVRNAGELVTRDRIIEDIWKGRIVSDSAITACVAAVRKAVGDDGKRQALIRTVARRGLRFVAAVSVQETASSSLPQSGTADPGVTIRYATARDGAKLAHAVHGVGEPVLQLRGPSNLELDRHEPLERAYIDAFSAHFMFIRFDQRGQGLSDPNLEVWDIDLLADDILAIANALKLDRIALIGVSGDAQIAVRFAAKYPERVSRLVIRGGYVDGRDVREPTMSGNAPDPLMGLTREGWDTESTAFLAALISIYQPDAPPEFAQRIAAKRRKCCTRAVEEKYRDGLNKSSIADQLARVRAPTLVIHSRNDSVHPLSEARKMASGIPDAELVVLESRNHLVMPHEDAWDIQLSVLLNFLKSVA